VKTVATMDDALAHAVDVCAQKQACAILASGCEHALSDPAEELCGLKQWEKLIAAPNLEDRDTQSLTSLCRQAGIVPVIFTRIPMMSQTSSPGFLPNPITPHLSPAPAAQPISSGS
jgi:hypothetical protein